MYYFSTSTKRTCSVNESGNEAERSRQSEGHLDSESDLSDLEFDSSARDLESDISTDSECPQNSSNSPSVPRPETSVEGEATSSIV